METIYLILLLAFGVYVLFKVLKFLKKKGMLSLKRKPKDKTKKTAKKKQLQQAAGTVKIVDRYMQTREVSALIALNRVLPKGHIALPKVGIANLVEPQVNRNLFNSIKDAFVDFVIFEEASMKPKLVVDIYDNSFADELLEQRHPVLVQILNNLGIKILEVAVRGEIDLSALKALVDKYLGFASLNEQKEQK